MWACYFSKCKVRMCLWEKNKTKQKETRSLGIFSIVTTFERAKWGKSCFFEQQGYFLSGMVSHNVACINWAFKIESKEEIWCLLERFIGNEFIYSILNVL